MLDEIIIVYLPWVISIVTILMNLLAGSMHKYTWHLGLVNQALWLIWILYTGKMGFLLMNLFLWVTMIVNLRKWKKLGIVS